MKFGDIALMKRTRTLPATWLVGRKTRLRPLETADVPMLKRFGLSVDPAASGFIVQTLDGADIGAVGLLIEGPHASVTVAFDHATRFSDGSARDALQVMCTGAFRSAPLERLEALVEARNAAAVRAYQRAGFKREGLLRQGLRTHAGYRDAIVLSIIRHG